MGAPQSAQFGPTLEGALAPGEGVKIKMTLGSATPKEKVGGGEANGKLRLGFVGGVLFKANCQEVSITPNRVRNTNSRNINPV